MWNSVEIIQHVKPKIVIWENVKNLLSAKHRPNFDRYLEVMSEAGYNNYYQVLNAKDYGIPQSRERIYTVSIRKDIDTGDFEFPEPIPLEVKLQDFLEDEVDDKFYISDKMVNYIIADNEKWTGNNNKSLINKTIASTINTGEGSRRCDASNYICRELSENFDLKVTCLLKNQATEISKITGISNTLLARDYKGFGNQEMNAVIEFQKKLRIRRLTPKECFRLMGFSDQDFNKAADIPTSNTQLYKMAGNSIVVKVLEHIFSKLFDKINI